MRLQRHTPCSALVVRAVCSFILSITFFWVKICSCDDTPSTFYKHEHIRFTSFYDQIWSVTDIVCCSTCHRNSSCNRVSYNHGSKECQLSSVSFATIGSNNMISDEWVTFSKIGVRVYEGCYTDSRSRVLIASTRLVNFAMMTLDLCEHYCIQGFYPYFGVEYGVECFCGNELPPSSAKTDDTGCDVPCTGNNKQTCGGRWKLSVYRITFQ